MGLFGTALGTILGGASKPSVPNWNDVTLEGAQAKSISANTTALPGIENIAKQTNAFNQDQITAMLEKVIPGWSQTAGAAQKNIAEMVSGKIPTDVSNAVQSSAAARALTGGYGGSQLGGNLTARDLGLTSLNLTQTGISSEESWAKLMSSLYMPGQFNISSMFITPQQEFNAQFQNQESKWNTQWLKNQVSAMPDPQWQAIGSALGGVADVATSYFTAGAMGQGIGKGLASGGISPTQNLLMHNDFTGENGGGASGSIYFQ